VILVSFNGEKWLPRCLESLCRQDPLPGVTAVDNGSSDRSPEILESFFRKHLPSGLHGNLIRVAHNIGFTEGVNLAVGRTEKPPEYFFLLNQDAWLESDCLAKLEESMRKNRKAAIIGPRILYPDGRTIQHAGGYLEKERMVGRHYGHHEKADPGKYNRLRKVDFVTGAAMMIRREAIGDQLPFNDVFSPGYYEDVELCRRLSRTGWKTLYEPGATAYHEESASFTGRQNRLRLAHRNRLIFLSDQLGNLRFRRSFLAAEKTFLCREASIDELIAVRGGCFDFLVAMPNLLKRRLEHYSGDETENIRSVLLEIAATAAKQLDAAFPLNQQTGREE